ncbi:MAG: bifunctional chorismate mutase/prephenate dehydratase [Kiritimatiellae bacterium]|nr:bifunctional chorismate mutase/prephenate dehydratase [Kiritimatiellia bacterium]
MNDQLMKTDEEIARLFKQRMDISLAEAQSARERGDQVCDGEQERESVSRALEIAGDGLGREMKTLFSTMIELSKARIRANVRGPSPLVSTITAAAQKSKPLPQRAFVACQGTDGSYAAAATALMFAAPTIVFLRDFESVFEMVEKGVCPYGVLPIENSSAGSVAQVYDLMVKHHFHIVRSQRVKVNHVLLGRRGASLAGIKEVASHPHALAQCRDFLKAMPGVKTVPAPNTATAARDLAEKGTAEQAVIASRACAGIYDLDILAENVSDNTFNYTRFICISREIEITPDADKFGIMLTLPHRPGSLSSILAKFAAAGVNLTKLESRPIPGMDFEFRFTFEFESSASGTAALALLSELSQDPEIEALQFLGAYA